MQHLAQEHPVSQGLCQVEDGRRGPHDPVVGGQDLAVYQPPPALSPLLHIGSGGSPRKAGKPESLEVLLVSQARRQADRQAGGQAGTTRSAPLTAHSFTISSLIGQFRNRTLIAAGHRAISPSQAHVSSALATTWN